MSTALVLLMTPGLALFYGGLNRSKGVLNMMMMSFTAIGLVSHPVVSLRLHASRSAPNDNASLGNT